MPWIYNPILGTDEWIPDVPISFGGDVLDPTHTVRGGNSGHGAGQIGGQTGNGPGTITNGGISSGPLQHGDPGPNDTPPVIPGPAGIVQSPQDARVQTISAAGGYLPIVYGKAKYAGLITHLGTNADGSAVVIGYSLGHGEIEKVVRVESYGYDDYGDRTVDSSFSRTWDSFACYHGSTSQTVNSTLASVFGETSGFPGVAYAVAQYALTLSGGEVSFPVFTVKGRKLYDPRENQIANSDIYTEASGWYDDGTFPTVATGVADPFGGTRAGRWTWGAGTHSIAHDGAATPASTDPVSVAVWLRVASGSLALTLRAHRNAEDATSSITVDTVWRRFTVTLAAGASGGACAIALDAVPASTVLEVFRAGIEINAAAAGPCFTSGAAVNPITAAYSTNPALAMADLKTAEFAGRVASTSVNWRSVCEAADWCDEQISALPRFSFGMVFTGQDRRPMRDAERTIGLHFGGRWQETNGTYSLVVNRPRSVSGQILEADIVGQPTCRRGTTAGLLDAPNRVTVEWTDPADGWKTKPVSVQGAEVEAGLPIREGSAYALHGCQTAQQARRHAVYILNGIEHDLAVSLVTQPKWMVLEVGDRIQLTDSALGFSARDFSVIATKRNEDGTVGLDLLDYSTDLWDESADGGESGGGGGDGGGIGGGDATVPDVTQPTISDSFVLCWYPARTLDTATLYGTGAWSLTNVTSGDTAKVNDAVENVSAGTFASAADTTFRLDATTGKAFTAARIVLAAGGTKTWPIEFSDDDAAWTAVSADFRAALLSPAPYGFRAEWTPPSAHRYWRVRKGSSVAGSEDLYELQFYTSVIYPSSHHVEILNGSGTVIAIVSAGVGQVCVDLSAFAVLAADGLTKTLSITIKNVSISGAKSTGVALTHTATVGALDSPQPVRMLKVDHTTHTATWQLGCVYGDTTRYGSSYWALTNVGASPDLSKINDGVTNVKAFDANAAGATVATLDITGESMAFCAVDFIVPSATKLFTDHTTSGTYPGSPSPTPGAGLLGVWAAEYWDGAAWQRPTQTIKTSSTVVTYSGRGAPADYPSQGWTADKYQITSSRIRIEWDPQLYSTARAKWRVIQTTTDAIALDVYEIQWLTFTRWNAGIKAFGVYAGLVSSSAGATQSSDGGVITPTGKSVAIGSVMADPPVLNVDYSFTSSSLAAGTVRRTAWPGSTGGYLTTNGWLDEVTVIPFAEATGGPALIEGTPRFAWDYSYSYAVGLGE